MKVGRQAKIIELISQDIIETQEELADLLMQAGYNVTQATVSRDIRELRLTKVATDDGRQRYIQLQNQESGLYEKYVRVLKAGYLSMEQAQNILVIKTVSGMAMAVAAALDSLNISGIVGCIAGDDTVMCVVRNAELVEGIIKKLNRLIHTDIAFDEEEKE